MSEGRRSVRRKLLQKHVGRGKLRSCSAGSPRVCENGRVARTSTSKGVDAASALEGSAPALAARLHQAPAGTRGRGAPSPPGLRGALPPQIRIQKLRNRRWTWVEEPLFPRYLFVGAGEGVS